MYKIILVVFILSLLLLSCSPSNVYKWEGDADYEGYKSEIKITIDKGLLTKIKFQILDINNDRVFDETYEELFSNDTYKEQCRNDLKGLQVYQKLIIENQGDVFDEDDIENIDAISGATWSYKKFKEALSQVLNTVKK